jgi:ferredoxin
MENSFKVEKYISKTNLKKVLKKLSQDAVLVGPVKAHGDIVFEQVKFVDDIVLNYGNCLNAPKDYMLLNDETLFKYDLSKGAELVCSTYPDSRKEIVIFGSRACDTKAVELLDKFFSRKFEDPVYLNKRKNILIISLMCQKLGQDCFCTSTRTGPYLEDGFDIQLIDIGDGYFLEAYSAKGKSFVKNFSNLMVAVNANKKAKRKYVVGKARNSKARDFNLDKVCKNLDKLNTKDKLWQDLAQRCQMCGGCLLICPTCSCFYVVDKKVGRKEGVRVRSLDTCFYESSTRMSAGYNPIRPRETMMKRKFYHKLWQQIDEFKQAGCTGCGRCTQVCPGNINWLDAIKRIEKRLV